MKIIILQGNTGKFAQVDDEDYERVNQYKWWLDKDGRAFTYNIFDRKTKYIRMHRFIMGVTDPNIEVDHHDNNSLNNQKYNLRICTSQQNNFNVKKYTKRKYSSIYKGVYFKHDYDRKKPWKATIKFNRKNIHIGYFATEIEAAKVYDIKAKELFGEFACLNFPDQIN